MGQILNKCGKARVPEGATVAASKMHPLAVAMGKGINLGNVFELPHFNSGDVVYGNGHMTITELKILLDKWRDMGFGHIRVPVRWFNQDGTDNRLVDLDEDLLEEVVAHAILNNGFYVIMNDHHNTWMTSRYNDTAVYNDAFYNNWVRIAKRFEEFDHHRCLRDNILIHFTVVFFFTISYPRQLLFEGPMWGSFQGASNLYPCSDQLPTTNRKLRDPYVGVAIHFYHPVDFTLPSMSTFLGNKYYKRSEKAECCVKEAMGKMNNWLKEMGTTNFVIMNEWGVGRPIGMKDELNPNIGIIQGYFTAVMKIAASKGLCSTVWNDFGWFSVTNTSGDDVFRLIAAINSE